MAQERAPSGKLTGGGWSLNDSASCTIEVVATANALDEK